VFFWGCLQRKDAMGRNAYTSVSLKAARSSKIAPNQHAGEKQLHSSAAGWMVMVTF